MSSEDEFQPNYSDNSPSDYSDGGQWDEEADWDTVDSLDKEKAPRVSKRKLSNISRGGGEGGGGGRRQRQPRHSRQTRADDGDELHYERRYETWATARKAIREKERVKNKNGEQRNASDIVRPTRLIATNYTNNPYNSIDEELLQEMNLPHPLFGEFSINRDLWLPGEIYTSLFEYQRQCLQWLWGLQQQETGGILGDEMGLGKTVQIISYLAALLYSNQWQGPALILCPATMLDQWVSEFNRWWPPIRTLVLHSSGSAMHALEEKAGVKRQATMRSSSSYSESVSATRINQMAEQLVERVFKHGHVLLATYEGLRRFRKILLRRKWFYAILDEGHKIRNSEADITITCKQLDTPHRIIVTGTPIQNNLAELWSLFDFIYPGRLGTFEVFDNQFAIPINMGGYANASRLQVEIAYKCATVLRDLIQPYLLKRSKTAVAKDLPKKTEHVVLCRLTTSQRYAYESFLRSSEMNSIMQGDRRVLYGIDILKKVCNHPDLLEINPSLNPTFGASEKSGKMRVLMTLLEQWQRRGHRVLLFSQTRIMLDILEQMVISKDYTYRRMDGNTPVQTRASLIHEFNHSDEIFLFLLTTKVGGLGINLVGADRVVIFDPDWNPSTDVQARERAWRLGQTRDVAIYRLITAGTIEEKIYHRQIFKHYLSRKILNDPKQKRFFKMHDLQDLFTLGADDAITTETGELFEGAAVEPPKWHKTKKTSTKEKGKNTQEDGDKTMMDQDENNEDGTSTDTPTVTSTMRKLSISDIKDITEYTPGSDVASHGETEEDALLKQLFTMSGVKSIIKHDNIADANNQETALIEKEAAMIVSHAAAALKEAGEEKEKRFGAVLKGRRGTGGPSSSALLKNLRRDNVPEGQKQELSGLMKELQQYLIRHNGRAKSQELVGAFQSRIKPGESLIFRKLLKEIANFERDNHNKTGWWHLKEEYQ
ncbi:SNF2 family N-terminal domain-containing protein [Syncephalis plumigaleata]|nr:SNF2 family N-terminal domain-containing protein [Syncephalis plumigaleata]